MYNMQEKSIGRVEPVPRSWGPRIEDNCRSQPLTLLNHR